MVRSSRETHAGKNQMISVVILSHERPRLLRQCIESLYANTPQEQFTCVVCDDESLDFRTKKYLRSLTYRNFSLLETQNSGHVLSQLKNTAVYYSEQRFGRGDFLYIGDSDTSFLPCALSKLTDAAIKTEPLGFRLWGGQIHPFHRPIGDPPSCVGFGCTDSDRGQVYVSSLGRVIPSSCVEGITEHSILDGPSWLMRWDTWDAAGPLDRATASGVCRSEEYPWCEKLKSQGGRIGVIYPHVVIHTGLSQADGTPAPGAEERRAMIPQGVLAE